jgi:hypothetical protein
MAVDYFLSSFNDVFSLSVYHRVEITAGKTNHLLPEHSYSTVEKPVSQ